MKRKRPLISDQLRQLVLNCGQTRYAICKATGIGQDVLSRFIHGERGLSMEVLDTLGEYLGLRIVTDKPTSKAKKGG